MRSEYIKLGGEFREPQKIFLEAMESRLPVWKTLVSRAALPPAAGEKFADVIEKRVAAAREPANGRSKDIDWRDEFTFGLLSDLLTAKGEAIAAGAPADEVIALTVSLKEDINNFLPPSQ